MLSALWSALTSRLAGWLAAAGVALGILLAAYNKGRQDAAARQAERRLKEIKNAREVEDEVGQLGAADIDARLREWMRDGR